MTTFNTNTDIQGRTDHASTVLRAAVAIIWQLANQVAAILTRKAPNPEHELAKIARREAARLATDNLLR